MRRIVVYIATGADGYIASGAKALDIRPPFGTARSRALTLKWHRLPFARLRVKRTVPLSFSATR